MGYGMQALTLQAAIVMHACMHASYDILSFLLLIDVKHTGFALA